MTDKKYDKVANHVDMKKAHERFGELANRIADDQCTELDKTPLKPEHKENIVYGFEYDMAVGANVVRDEYLLIGCVIGAGIMALGVAIRNKFKKKKAKES